MSPRNPRLRALQNQPTSFFSRSSTWTSPAMATKSTYTSQIKRSPSQHGGSTYAGRMKVCRARIEPFVKTLRKSVSTVSKLQTPEYGRRWTSRGIPERDPNTRRCGCEFWAPRKLWSRDGISQDRRRLVERTLGLVWCSELWMRSVWPIGIGGCWLKR